MPKNNYPKYSGINQIKLKYCGIWLLFLHHNNAKKQKVRIDLVQAMFRFDNKQQYFYFLLRNQIKYFYTPPFIKKRSLRNFAETRKRTKIDHFLAVFFSG